MSGTLWFETILNRKTICSFFEDIVSQLKCYLMLAIY